MSDSIKHECGIALLRLKKDLSFYHQKYGTALYGLNKLYLLMEKQHNRGQDGAGVANIKLDVPPGTRYISRHRSNSQKPIQDVFDYINRRFAEVQATNPELLNNPAWMKENLGFVGELYLGHVRYGTFGKNSIESCHPFLRQNNWMTRNLVVAGNFNLTNVDELFSLLVGLGQHPKERSDTVTVMEKIGHFLDEENQRLFDEYNALGYPNEEITQRITRKLDVHRILKRASADWDGGYTIGGLLGHGDAFVVRDPNGIRPAFWYENDEIAVVASERPVIQTAFNLRVEDIRELEPGHALVIKKDGQVSSQAVREPGEKRACSFERIYFSRGSDADIYRERIALGHLVCPAILKAIDHDLANTVFSFIPNTAEVAFFGLMKGMEDHLNELKQRKIEALGASPDAGELRKILQLRPRMEKIAIKDAKLRTFITQDESRNDMVAHVYDVTYGTVQPGKDTLVVIDDSIVRGTTLRQSIIRILDRLEPARIIIVSSAPQIRYPDCYGIDMAKLGDFIAFQAAISLLKERGMQRTITEVYERCKASLSLPKEQITNYVKAIYEPFTEEEISERVTTLLKAEDVRADVQIIFQRLEDLHVACPNHRGDWYFSGNYPTPGGNKVVNRAFVNYFEGRNERAY